MHSFYPEWRQGQKKAISIRHLLNHTSGIQQCPSCTTEEVYPAPDVVQLALTAELEQYPGTHFSYNNKATNLLAGLVEKASGLGLDSFLKVHLTVPMGITEYSWEKDAAGNALVMSGFFCHPKELAKIGVLMANNGLWNGQRVLSEAVVKQITRPSDLAANCALLWWVEYANVTYTIDDNQLDALRKMDFSPGFMDTLEQTKGQYSSLDDLFAMFERVMGEDWKNTLMHQLQPRGAKLTKKQYHQPIGFSGRGHLGQYLCVFPEKGLVGLRMIESTDAYRRSSDEFSEFSRLVYELSD